MAVANGRTAIEDPLDLAIIRALQVAPRAPFRLLAEVLQTSEQTVARRYRRLAKGGVLRVTAVVAQAALGQSNWIVRVQCKPGGAMSLAQALAQRPDIGWVSVSGGGSEVMCVLRSRTDASRDDLLLQKLPRTGPVLGVSVAVVLHRFIGERADDWTGLLGTLSEEQERRLTGAADTADSVVTASDSVVTASDSGVVGEAADAGDRNSSTELDGHDFAMLEVLTRDGRAPYSALAAAAQISEGRAQRRLRALLRERIAYFDIDLAASALGFHCMANLWLTVAPAALEAAGRALAEAPEVAFAAAISGSHNLTASIMCRDLEALYRFLTTSVGAIPGVQTVEVSPSLRVIKQAGTLVAGDRLAVE